MEKSVTPHNTYWSVTQQENIEATEADLQNKKHVEIWKEIIARNRAGLKNHTGHINMQTVSDEKLWNQFATYISPTNRLANRPFYR